MDYDEAIMLISHLKGPIITVLNTLSLSLLKITILLGGYLDYVALNIRHHHHEWLCVDTSRRKSIGT